MHPSPTGASAAPADPRRWKALAFLGTAQLMLIVDITIVTIALPQISVDLGLNREATTWVVSAYTLAFGGLMLLGGRISDLVGSRDVVLSGLGLFAAASLVAGLADSPEALISGRIGQGVGAALLSPAALSAVVQLFEGDERNRALGIWSALGGGGAALGVLLGGVLAAGPGWAWVFYVNIPIGVIVAAGLARLLPRRPGRATGGVDIIGAVLVTAATGTVIYALIGAGDRGWTSTNTVLLLVFAVGLYVVFGVRQLTTATPLMDLGLLARRPVASGTFLIVGATALMVSGFFLGTFYLQHHAGHGPLLTGLLFLPVALATTIGAIGGGHAVGRFGARALALGGFVVATLGFAIPALFDGSTAVVGGITVGASGLGVLFVAASATALGQVEPHEAGIASGIVSTFHEFGASLGAAVISSVAAVSIGGAGAAGYVDGFLLAAMAAGVAGVVALLVVPGRSAEADATEEVANDLR